MWIGVGLGKNWSNLIVYNNKMTEGDKDFVWVCTFTNMTMSIAIRPELKFIDYY